ncbi:unnamed protein product, partial [Oikopleura dioica]
VVYIKASDETHR